MTQHFEITTTYMYTHTLDEDCHRMRVVHFFNKCVFVLSLTVASSRTLYVQKIYNMSCDVIITPRACAKRGKAISLSVCLASSLSAPKLPDLEFWAPG